jgi:hypothetical protein
MRDYSNLVLPPGYKLDLVGDPCVISLCRANGTVVARFTYASDPQEIKRAAEEDRAKREESNNLSHLSS